MADQEIIIDFASDVDKRRFWALLRSLDGKWRFTFCRFRKRRTNRQNRYYWPCFVMPLAAFLREQEEFTDIDAHELLKHKFLRATKINPKTGEPYDYTRRSRDLSTAEFNDYLDRCAAWLADTFDIVVPSPDEYHEKETEQVAGKAA